MWWLVLVLLLCPGIAEAGATAATFGPGGVGFSIVQLILLAAFGALASYVTSALGQGQISSMIKLVTVFSCIAIVIGVVWKAISSIAKVFNVDL